MDRKTLDYTKGINRAILKLQGEKAEFAEEVRKKGNWEGALLRVEILRTGNAGYPLTICTSSDALRRAAETFILKIFANFDEDIVALQNELREALGRQTDSERTPVPPLRTQHQCHDCEHYTRSNAYEPCLSCRVRPTHWSRKS